MEDRNSISDAWFWTLTLLVGALGMGAAFAVVIGRIAGAGIGAGLFFGLIVFAAAALFVATFAGARSLPPPNSVTAPTVPRSASSQARPDPGRPAVEEDLPGTVGGKVARASYHAGAAVRALGAAVSQAATEASGAVTSAASNLGGTVARTADEARREILPAATAPAAAPAAAAARVEVPVEPTPAATQPAGVAAPGDGEADDLKRIRGVGPKLESLLHGLGIFHFHQIAAWTEREVAWVDSNLAGFHGRATRDGWVEQARVLAGGGSTEFSRRVDRGEVYDD
jgi:predicted flap endonuclease-1-like 5' DNA nuclease